MLPPVAQALPSGTSTQLGRYTLLRRLAVGGMAEIYLAKVKGLEGFEKLVVLKQILPQHAGDGDFIRMFLQEARLAATLHHSNIAQVYDVDRVGSTYFLTMEYVHGVDVRQIWKAARQKQSRIPLEHAIFIVLGALAGLDYAHEQCTPDGKPLGIVHRDVSPSNILVGFDGGVKLVDFGIAKTTQRQETRTGTVKGKLAYMSPEQCLGQRVDRRSDLFSIGIVLYELTTSTALFARPNELDLAAQIMAGIIPPPSERVPDYPKALEAIVLRALRRDPNERYATAKELHVALDELTRKSGCLGSTMALADYTQELFGAPSHVVWEGSSAPLPPSEAPPVTRDTVPILPGQTSAPMAAAVLGPSIGAPLWRYLPRPRIALGALVGTFALSCAVGLALRTPHKVLAPSPPLHRGVEADTLTEMPGPLSGPAAVASPVLSMDPAPDERTEPKARPPLSRAVAHSKRRTKLRVRASSTTVDTRPVPAPKPADPPFFREP